ncbi:MAG: hypothetical protein QW590_00990 [Candidatus Bilamarchaeaceae archaeon]
MKLKYDTESTGPFALEAEGERNAGRKNKWYDKLYDIAAKFGERFEKIACIVSVPVMVAFATPKCTCSRIELVGDPHMRDVPVDVSHEDALDVRDGVEDDAQGGCEVVDIPETEASAPCENLAEKYALNNLIGDYLNRTLDDRVPNEVGNTNAEYPFETAETSENANPFSDGMGGTIGPMETYLYRITDAMFPSLASPTIRDNDTNKTYTETQNIWIRGSSYYDEPVNDVVGDVRFVAYTMKFGGESDIFGIPVCTTSVGGDYTYCKSGAEDADYTYATETHRVRIQFLGSDWLITEMSPPVISVTNEIRVQNGGYVKLGKELMGGIVNKDEALPIDCLRFKLDDVEEHDGTHAAIISVLDEYGNVLKGDKVFPGQTKEFNIDGRVYRLHVWKVAPGHGFGAVWADISILSDEIKIKDGQHLDPGYDRFREWKTFVGWKNKDATAISANPYPDHLRTVGIYADDVADISSSGDARLPKGEGFNFPYAELSLCYDGLDIGNDERSTLTFTLEKNNDFEYYVDDDYCKIYAPYVKIVSEVPFASFVAPETNEVYIAISGAEFKLSGDVDVFEPGALVAIYPSGGWFAADYEPGLVIYLIAGEPDEPAVSIDWARWEDGSAGYVDPARAVDHTPSFVFKIKEIAGGDVSLSDAATYFATDGNSFNLNVRYLDTGEQVFGSNHVVYQAAGPVQERGTSRFIDEGTITERGSVFRTIDDTQVVFDIANRVGYSVFYIGKKSE